MNDFDWLYEDVDTKEEIEELKKVEKIVQKILKEYTKNYVKDTINSVEDLYL